MDMSICPVKMELSAPWAGPALLLSHSLSWCWVAGRE